MPTRSTLIAAGVGATALAAGVVGVWYYRRAKAAQRAAALVVADAPEYAPDALLYRIVTVDDWEATLARGDGVYTGTDFDAKDGFIHLSTASTVPATAAFLASRGDELRVLSIGAPPPPPRRARARHRLLHGQLARLPRVEGRHSVQCASAAQLTLVRAARFLRACGCAQMRLT